MTYGLGWPRFTPEDPQIALLDERGITVGSLPNQAQLDFFEQQLAKHAVRQGAPQ